VKNEQKVKLSEVKQQLERDMKNKYELEELRVDSHLEDVSCRKMQIMQQMKER